MRHLPIVLALHLCVLTPALAHGIELTDSLYSAHHPRLLFSTSDIPSLQNKMTDGGRDDEAYARICSLATYVYPAMSPSEFLDLLDFALSDYFNLCVYAQIEADSVAAVFGKDVTLLLARNWDPENAFFGSLRLRELALGYDNCFAHATSLERDSVRVEIETYIDSMLVSDDFELFRHRPFVSNITAMVGSALGLAAIVLDGETDPGRVSAALARADDIIDTWQQYQLDPGGSYKEGVMYGSWSLRNLIPYFVARKRYDGYDYGARPAIRDIEKWLAFELLPVDGGQLNNLNAAASTNFPVSRHNTYLDWAQSEWNSGLSAWLWERILGPDYGHDSGRLRDTAATALWSQPVAQVHPGSVLDKHAMWADRGLYYFRTGWQTAASSDDVVFSFYSGKFHGGHTQEDDNSFTLYGYGERFAIDHGFFAAPAGSPAHNMTFIDGAGQHYSGASFGTDGRIVEYLLGDFADYVFGDATQSYTTYSEFNEPDVPFPGFDWSSNYIHANPVQKAHRRFVVVHDNATPVYFFYVEDIRKDDASHLYEWRMHTDDIHTVDMASNPMVVNGASGKLAMHVLSPPFDSLATGTDTFVNGHSDPDATVLELGINAVAPSFVMLWFPMPAGGTAPAVTSVSMLWGEAASVDLGGGVTDIVAVNRSGATVAFSLAGCDVTTDAALLVLRREEGATTRFLATGATTLTCGAQVIIEIGDGAADVTLDGDAVRFGRMSTDFRVYAPQASAVLHEETSISFTRDGDYVSSDTTSSTPDRPPVPAMYFTANPIPSPGNVTIEIGLSRAGALNVTVYDVKGRRIAVLWDGNLNGATTFDWRPGAGVSSGVYFIRARGGGTEQTRKVVLVR